MVRKTLKKDAITITIKFSDPNAAKKFLGSPKLAALVKAFDIKYKKGGSETQGIKEKEFVASTLKQLNADPKLKAKAIRWLFQEVERRPIYEDMGESLALIKKIKRPSFSVDELESHELGVLAQFMRHALHQFKVS